MHWTENFVGKPWKPAASGPDAFDCWGLLTAIYRERLGVTLNQATVAEATDQAARRLAIDATIQHGGVFGAWTSVDKPRDLDAVVMGDGTHVGLWLADVGAVLHSREKAGVALVKLNGLRGQGVRFKFFRLQWPSSS
jgi:cell wall-associated NlpC family hydrolase